MGYMKMITVETSGMREGQDFVKRLPVNMRIAGKETTNLFADQIVAWARIFAPHDTGKLQNSIRKFVIGEDQIIVSAIMPKEEDGAFSRAAYMELGMSPHKVNVFMHPRLFQWFLRHGMTPRRTVRVGTHATPFRGKGYHPFLNPAVEAVRENMPKWADIIARRNIGL